MSALLASNESDENKDVYSVCSFCSKRFCLMPFPENTPDFILAAYGETKVVATCDEGKKFEVKKFGYCWDSLWDAIHEASPSHHQWEMIKAWAYRHPIPKRPFPPKGVFNE